MARSRARPSPARRGRGSGPAARGPLQRKSNELSVRATLELARDRATLAALLDPVITLNAKGIVVSASDAVRRVFGWRPADLVGRSVGLLMPEPHASAHAGYIARHVRTGQAGVLGRPRQFEAVRRDGTRIPVEISISRTHLEGEREPLFVGIVRDVSERRRLEDSLRTSERRMRLAMQVAGAGVWDWDLRADEAWWSDEMYELWGIPRGTRMCRRCSLECIVDADRTRVAGVIDHAIARRRDYQCEFRIRHPVRGERWMQSHGRIDLDAAGAPVRVLGLTLDISDRKRSEAELNHHRENLEQLVAERTNALRRSQEQVRVQDRMASIGTLAAGLGHDMNNVLLPMRAHLLAAGAACGRNSHAAVQESIAHIQRGVDYLQHLADGLHFLTLDPEYPDGGCTDLSRWWEQSGALLCKGVPKHVRVLVEFGRRRGRCLPNVAIAPHRLTQAVLNLMVNAGQAIVPPGKSKRRQGIIRIRAVELPAAASRTGTMVRLQIEDNGIGMSEEVKRHAFEMFFTTKPRGLGTGLGLPLVARVVQNAGGTVTIDSTPGVGTTVSLDLPAMPALKAESTRPTCATISLRDQRVAGVFRQLFEAAGLETRDGDAPDQSQIWVVKPSATALAAARAWRAGAGSHGTGTRRIVLVGPVTKPGLHKWSSLKPIHVPQPSEFNVLRQAVSRVISGG